MGSAVQETVATRPNCAESAATAADSPVRGGVTSEVVARPPAGAPPEGENHPGGGVEPRRVQEIPPRSQGLVVRSGLARGFASFKKSAAPSRVLFFAGGMWNDFPLPVLEALREGFSAGRAILEVPVADSPCLFDLVRMVQINVATEALNPIAWIDVDGQCFFPRMAADGGPKLEIEVKINKSARDPPPEESLERKKKALEPVREYSDESRVVSDPSASDRPIWAGLQVLEERDKSYKAVEMLFLAGMRRFAPATRITSIRRCAHGGPSGSSRLKLFQMWAEMTKAARGTANMRYGWYGASAAGVASAVNHGFGQPNNRSVSPEAEAVGVYLSPPQCPHASSLMSEPDHAGEKHVLLCRVIMGNAEKVDIRSPRWHPAGNGFDCGMDDLEKPRWCIVWNTHMNTHILPEFVVSFKSSETGRLVREGSPVRTPAMKDRLFAKMFAEMGTALPSSAVRAMQTLYNHFKAGRTTKDVFIRNLRTIAGEKLLVATMKKFHMESRSIRPS